jgi:ribonuclease J
MDNWKNFQHKTNKKTGWYKDIKKAIEANEKMHKKRLGLDSKSGMQSKGKIKVTPLGGLNEIGGNILVIENDKSAIIIDAGMSFPTEEMHGVDILVPDFGYLKEIKKKIDGLLITHAHEDHIGAVPYLFRELQVPVYGTPLPLGMIANKFDEHNIRSYKSYFRYVEKREPIKIGDFEVEWIHITHSIIDASALAIKTDVGVIIHTGDFKIDHTPIDGYPTDLHRLAFYGENGVLALFSDSTNSHNEGITKSEASVGATFDLLFSKSRGRVIMSTFSSNIHRVYQAIDHALKYNRKICVIGRSMERNLETAMQLGYVKLPSSIFIESHHLNRYADNEILIITTGSQGETMSALYRMAINEHRHVKIKPSDTIIISAKAIPGNERSVSSIINLLQKCGATVAYHDFSEIHVSGHAAQEEQKLMIRLVKPKFFLPVHGEHNHLVKHKETAIKCGINEKNIYLMSDGDQIEITNRYIKKIKNIKVGKSYIDNQLNEEIETDVVIDRQKIATEGIVIVVAQISVSEKKLLDTPKVSSFGLIGDKHDKSFAKEIEELIENFLRYVKPEHLTSQRRIENELRQVIRKHIFRKMKKYPTIVPTIFLM